MSFQRQPAAFTVTGRGDFPFDMLRKARCYPATGEDAAKLPRPDSPTQRAIRLVACQLNEIAPERWESFGWKVHDIDEAGAILSMTDDWVIRQEANRKWSIYDGMAFRKGGFASQSAAQTYIDNFRAEVAA